jgi:hypothetical protein
MKVFPLLPPMTHIACNTTAAAVDMVVLPWLQAGDCVILNAANSTTGQVVIQLCKILRLRVVAIVRKPEEVGTWLRELGATVVMSDTAPIKVRWIPITSATILWLADKCGRRSSCTSVYELIHMRARSCHHAVHT